MRVLHVISSFLLGGAEKMLIDIISISQKDADYSFLIINSVYDSDLLKSFNKLGVKVYFFNRRPGSKNLAHLLKLFKLIKFLKPDVIHTHDFASKILCAICKLFFQKVKLVRTMHCIKGAQLEWTKFKYLFDKHLVDINIAVSNSVYDVYQKAGLFNVETVYNGVKTEIFNMYCNDEYQPNNKIVNVARLSTRQKGQDILIKALRICKDNGFNIKCDFIGGEYDYDKTALPYLRGLVRKLDLSGEISFLGQMNNIETILPNYSLFVLPSRSEAFGLVIVEAMAAGLVVVASNVDGPRELIEDGVTGFLFESENFEELAMKLMELFKNPLFAKEIRENSIVHSEQFNISKTVSSYLNIYQRIARS